MALTRMRKYHYTWNSNSHQRPPLLTWITYRGLVTSYGDKDLGQHGSRSWIAAWRHQAITWTNFDLSSIGFCTLDWDQFHRKWSRYQLKNWFWKNIHVKIRSHLPEANELTLIPAWISNYIHGKMEDEITYLISSYNSNVEVWEWIKNQTTFLLCM